VKTESDAESMQNHAQKLRKVSEQMLGGTSRTRQSFTGIPSPAAVTRIPTSSRPPSRVSHMGDSSPFGNVAGREMRPSSYAGAQNTVGLPAALLNTSLTDTKIPKLSRKLSATQTPDNGLLSTIEKAAHSDDECSPPPLPMKDEARKHSGPPVFQNPSPMTRIPKMSTSTPLTSSSSLSQECNYENVAATAEFVASRQGKNISTANYVNSPSSSSSSNQSKIPGLQQRALSPTLSLQGSQNSGNKMMSPMSKIPTSVVVTPTSKIPMRKTS
jgi:hypothetical protein